MQVRYKNYPKIGFLTKTTIVSLILWKVGNDLADAIICPTLQSRYVFNQGQIMKEDVNKTAVPLRPNTLRVEFRPLISR